MVSKLKLDSEDEKILEELDNICGVSQNKEVLRDLIFYIKLKQNNELDFGNYNIIIRNNSSYNLLNDFLKVCSKIFMKYNIIENNKICYFDKIANISIRRDFNFEKILGIDDGIIVINERKLKIDYSDCIDNLKNVLKQIKGKVIIFEDINFCEGEVDAELGELANFRMTIEKISLEDKIFYCENKLDKLNIKYKKNDLKDYCDVPFWVLKNMVTKLIIECKSKSLDFVDKQMLKKNKEFYSKKSSSKRRNTIRSKKENNSQKQLEELVGLDNIKSQMNKILNYIKLNKERGQLPSLHMCFTGNPRYWKNQYS